MKNIAELARTGAFALTCLSPQSRYEVARQVMSVLQREIVEQREPDFQVLRGSDKKVYLRRWWVVPRNNEFNVYLHNMLADDDDVLHDHMYESWSLCLGGVLREVYQESPPHGQRLERVVQQGDVTTRTEHMAHQLLVMRPAWTLFVTGPRVKEWGFWCPKGFRHWSKYIAPDQDPSVQGNGLSGTKGAGYGCGEQS